MFFSRETAEAAKGFIGGFLLNFTNLQGADRTLGDWLGMC